MFTLVNLADVLKIRHHLNLKTTVTPTNVMLTWTVLGTKSVVVCSIFNGDLKLPYLLLNFNYFNFRLPKIMSSSSITDTKKKLVISEVISQESNDTFSLGMKN